MSFEDKFTKKQKDMISLAPEYVERINVHVNNIYIYCSHENNMYTFDLFFGEEKKIYLIHQLSLDSDPSLMIQVLQIGNQDLQEIHEICKKYDRPMPTQIKIIYDNVNKKVHADYSYELFYSNSDTLTSNDIFNQWFEEVKAEVEGK